MSFEHFNLHDEVQNGLRDMGFEKPTPIQEACISLILEGRDILASAQTGTGKTAAFAIPVLEKLSEKKKQKKEGIRALVITPTRELAGQVDEAFFAIGYHTGLSTAKVYGGDDWSRQEKALSRGTNIIVATPGRLLDHMKIHDVDFSNLDFLILDEADRMLDMGFIPDITQIVSQLPKERQTLLFSATLPQKIVQLAKKMMNNPERVNMAPSNKVAEGVTQSMYYVEERDKLPLVLHLFEKEKWPSAIIFMSTKRAVDKLTRELNKKGADVTSIHGDRSQEEREMALESFRKGEYRIIVATDVMARGIDVEGISHVINFSVPHDVEDYVHRIGRTARADATGDAVTLVSGQDRRYMENIIHGMEAKIEKKEVPDSLRKQDSSDSKNKGGRSDSKGKGREAGKKGSQPKKKGEDKGRSEKKDDAKPSRPKPDKSKAEEKKSDSKTARGDDPKTGVAGKDKDKEGDKKSAEEKPDSSATADAGKQETSERPKRRRGRKRPGGNRRSGKGHQGDQSKKPDEPQKSPKDDRSDSSERNKKGGPRRKSSEKGKKVATGKSGLSGSKSGKKQKPTGKEAERKELFENISSPDMELVNKSVGKKRGVWSKIKGLLGGE